MRLPTRDFRADADRRARFLLGHFEHATGERADAEGIAFVSRDLLQVMQTQFEVQYSELMGMMFLPPPRDRLDPGAAHFTWQSSDFAGEAKISQSLDDRAPTVDVSVLEEAPTPFFNVTEGWTWTVDDLRAAAFARRPLPRLKPEAARKVIAIKHDDLLLIADGSPKWFGIRGLFKLLNTCTYALPNGGSNDPRWEKKTGEEIYSDLFEIANAPKKATNGIEVTSHIALPTTLMLQATKKRMGDGNSESALDYFLRQQRRVNPGFQDVLVNDKLETAGATGNRRVMSYMRRNDKVFRADSVEYEEFPPSIDGPRARIEARTRTAGAKSPWPKSICYADQDAAS